jgi:hypothetical protein
VRPDNKDRSQLSYTLSCNVSDQSRSEAGPFGISFRLMLTSPSDSPSILILSLITSVSAPSMPPQNPPHRPSLVILEYSPLTDVQ